MAPKAKKKKAIGEKFRCDEVEGERFHAQTEDVFKYNWWEVFCFPYILCARFWDCCVSLCAGTNQCMVYWMVIQWIVCKITKLTTPNAIIFPYYFYMFCQVILLTIFFIFLWHWFGRTVLIPYFVAFYEAIVEDELPVVHQNATRLAFRKYCFRKGEIFDSTVDFNSAISFIPRTAIFVTFIILYVLIFN
jgi:hypothetical protein